MDRNMRAMGERMRTRNYVRNYNKPGIQKDPPRRVNYRRNQRGYWTVARNGARPYRLAPNRGLPPRGGWNPDNDRHGTELTWAEREIGRRTRAFRAGNRRLGIRGNARQMMRQADAIAMEDENMNDMWPQMDDN